MILQRLRPAVPETRSLSGQGNPDGMYALAFVPAHCEDASNNAQKGTFMLCPATRWLTSGTSCIPMDVPVILLWYITIA